MEPAAKHRPYYAATDCPAAIATIKAIVDFQPATTFVMANHFLAIATGLGTNCSPAAKGWTIGILCSLGLVTFISHFVRRFSTPDGRRRFVVLTWWGFLLATVKTAVFACCAVLASPFKLCIFDPYDLHKFYYLPLLSVLAYSALIYFVIATGRVGLAPN